MTKKNIAIISYHTCPLASEEGKETGGMNVYVLSVARALSKQGWTVDVFTRSQDTQQPKIVSITDDFRVIHIKAGPEIYILPNSATNKKLLFDSIPEFVENVKAFQMQENIVYDVFDCHYYLSGLAGLALKKDQPNVPLLMTFHTLALMKSLIAHSGLSDEEHGRIEAEFRLVKQANVIISPSKNDSKYLQALYDAPEEKIRIIPPGVDTSLFYPSDKIKARETIGAPLDQKLVMFVGRIEPVKGIDVLLYATKILLKQNPDIKICLWIVGGDLHEDQTLWSAELKKLEKLRTLLSLTTTVKFVGQQSQHDLPSYYNAADLVVMPSHYESFGLSVLEAMACGVPVITSNVTGVSELIDDRCKQLITTANNPLLLADQMADVLARHHHKSLHEVHLAITDLDWEKVAKKISAVYKTTQ